LPDTLAGEDWVACRRLLDAGCEVLMPWAAPIGTGQGPRNPSGLRELGERAAHVPLIVDAGLGLPSHAPQALEWGFDGVLVNTGGSRATDPLKMAGPFAGAVRAGRAAFLAGPMIVQELAVPGASESGRPFAQDFPVVVSNENGKFAILDHKSKEENKRINSHSEGRLVVGSFNPLGAGKARHAGVSGYNTFMLGAAIALSDHPLVTNQLDHHAISEADFA
jgi:hypothetical protein